MKQFADVRNGVLFDVRVPQIVGFSVPQALIHGGDFDVAGVALQERGPEENAEQVVDAPVQHLVEVPTTANHDLL